MKPINQPDFTTVYQRMLAGKPHTQQIEIMTFPHGTAARLFAAEVCARIEKKTWLQRAIEFVVGLLTLAVLFIIGCWLAKEFAG